MCVYRNAQKWESIQCDGMDVIFNDPFICRSLLVHAVLSCSFKAKRQFVAFVAFEFLVT